MNARMLRGRALPVTLCGLALLAWTSSTRGAITEITASLEANVTELVGGQSGSTDNSIENFPLTSPTLPIEALAGLGDFSGEIELNAGGLAASAFADPTLPDDPNPGEFGVEAVVYSLNASTAYDGDAQSIETRTINLSAEELGVAAAGDEQLTFSTAFVEGAALIWTDDATRDLTGVTTEFQFRIVQVTSNGTETVVFESELTVAGQPDGEVALTNSSILNATLGGPEVLSGVGGADTQGVVASLADIGRVHVVLLPTQSVQYAYFATAGEPFELRAEASCRAVGVPGGAGAAAVFGRPFADLEFALTPFTGQAKAAKIQAVMNQAMRTAQSDGGTVSPLCGALGAETPLLLFAGFCCARRRRRL
ncbi:MAG TPA: hypothetical protein P5572_14360 [Phycisphaerae bacterium]|nr:hypothetical protein [Phycisphaerae bacterium]